MKRFLLLTLTILLLPGCDRADFRHGHSPGDVETIDNAKVYHLADGIFVVESKNGNTCYYLIESTVANYELTPEGLDVQFEGEKGTYSTKPAPAGYVAAWITTVEGDVPGVTRFQLDDAAIADAIDNLTEATTVQDVYILRQ